jgi:hypothetical protein
MKMIVSECLLQHPGAPDRLREVKSCFSQCQSAPFKLNLDVIGGSVAAADFVTFIF